MSAAASQDNATRNSVIARAVIYVLLILFAVYYLLPLYVMLVNSLKPLERDPRRQHAEPAARVDHRAVAFRLVDGADRRRSRPG